MANDELLSTRKAAEYLGCSVLTIQRHLYHTHKLKADTRTVTGLLLFKVSTLDAFRPIIGRRGRRKSG